tara:strand:+ start:493 stop:672 length:180 start_codon:yes stop_codon:yes gene_type:complete
MTNYQTALLKIAEAETKYEFISIDRQIRSQYTTGALTLDEYIKLDNRSTDLYTAIYWSE